MIYRQIFSSFLKIGALTFGGGYAMLPILQSEAIRRRGWLDEREVADCYAIAGCLPGVIMINVAAIVGRKLAGWTGSAVACIAAALPSFVIVTLLAAFIQNFLEYEIVGRVFWGVRVVVCAMIVQAIAKLWKVSIKGRLSLAIYLGTLGMAVLSGAHIILIVISAVCIGILSQRLQEGKK